MRVFDTSSAFSLFIIRHSFKYKFTLNFFFLWRVVPSGFSIQKQKSWANEEGVGAPNMCVSNVCTIIFFFSRRHLPLYTGSSRVPFYRHTVGPQCPQPSPFAKLQWTEYRYLRSIMVQSMGSVRLLKGAQQTAATIRHVGITSCAAFPACHISPLSKSLAATRKARLGHVCIEELFRSPNVNKEPKTAAKHCAFNVQEECKSQQWRACDILMSQCESVRCHDAKF